MAVSAGAIYVDVKGNTKPIEQSMSGLGSIAAKVGSKIAGALSVAALVKFGASCVELASNLNEVQNVVDVTFPTMAARMDEWAQSAADNFGLSETMAKRYAGTFGSMAEAFGFTEQQAYDMGTALTGLAGDVASFYNIGQDEAYTKLKSVFSGETESLKELGVVMTQSALDQYALANGFGATTAQMSEQEKVGLRLAFVQSALSNASGDFSRTSGSWANQVRLLTLRFDSLRATIGQGLIAVLLPVVRGLNAIVLAATNAARAFNSLIEAITGRSMAELTGGAEQVSVDLSTAATGASGALGDLADAQGRGAKAAKDQSAAQKELNRTLASFDKITKLTSQSASGGSGGSGGGSGGGTGGAGGGAGGGGVGSAVESEMDKAQKAIDRLRLPESLLAAIERVREAFGRLGETISIGLSWAYENVLKPLAEFGYNTVLPDTLNLVADAIGHVNDFLNNIADPLGRFLTMCEKWVEFQWTKVLQPLLDFATNEVLPRVLDGIATAFDIVVTCAEKLSPVLQFLYEEVLIPLGRLLGNTILMALDGVNRVLGWVLDEVRRADFGPFIANLKDAKKWLGDKLGKAAEIATGAIRNLRSWWDGFKNKAATLTAEAREKAAGALKKLRKKWDAIKDKAAKLTAEVKTTAAKIKNWWKQRTKEWKDKRSKLMLWAETAFQTVKRWWNERTKPWGDKRASLSVGTSQTSTGIGSLWSSITKLWKNKDVKLTATNSVDSRQVTAANSALAPFKNKSASLTATNNAKPGVDAANKTISGLTGKAASLTAKNDTASGVSAAQSKINGIKGKTVSVKVEVQKTGIKGINVKSKAAGGGWFVEAYANGGWIPRNTPRLAVIGDNRREGEIVSPESKFQTMLDEATRRGGGSEVLLPVLNEILSAIESQDHGVYLDGRAITRSVVDGVNAQTRATGRCPIVV